MDGAQVLETKSRLEAVIFAIEHALDNGVDAQGVKKLRLNKQVLEEQYKKMEKKILKNMGLARNLMALERTWFAIRYIDKEANTQIKIVPLVEGMEDSLLRDGRSEPQLELEEILSIERSALDHAEIDWYLGELNRATNEMLLLHTSLDTINPHINDKPVEVEVKVEESKPIVSSHARLRWVQRKLNIITEQDALKYLRSHVEEVEKEVLEAFDRAELAFTDLDGINYYLDEHNIMYVSGDDNVIVTLYEEDFGFSKEINRSITLQQLEVLDNVKGELNKAKEENAIVCNEVDRELEGYDNSIKQLEAQIALLNAKRQSSRSRKDESDKELKVVQARYNSESNKLFKKWEYRG